MKRLNLALIALVAACGAPVRNSASLEGCGVDPFAGTLSFQGHRASSFRFPDIIENSLGSLLALLSDIPLEGEHRVEFDVSTTLDGQLVILHDKDTCRVSDTDVVVAETPYVDLPLLKDGQKIPLLSEFTDALIAHDASDLHINFDLKGITESSVEGLGDLIEDVSKHHKVMMYLNPRSRSVQPALCSRFGGRFEVLDYYGPTGEYCGYEYAPICARLCE